MKLITLILILLKTIKNKIADMAFIIMLIRFIVNTDFSLTAVPSRPKF